MTTARTLLFRAENALDVLGAEALLCAEIRAFLAAPEPEPFAWWRWETIHGVAMRVWYETKAHDDLMPLYAAPPAAPPASDTKSKTVCQTDDTCEVDVSDIDEEGRVPGCIVETYWMPVHTIEVRDGMLMLTGDDGGTDAQMRVMLADIPGFAPPAAPEPVARVPDEVRTALFDCDDHIARMHGNDRGGFEPVEVLRRFLDSLDAAAPPAGYVLVPVEPTQAMSKAFWLAGPYPEKPFTHGYAAMLAAAPKGGA